MCQTDGDDDNTSIVKLRLWVHLNSLGERQDGAHPISTQQAELVMEKMFCALSECLENFSSLAQ